MSATLLLLASLQAANAAQEDVLSEAREALSAIQDTADARAAGFMPFEFHDQIDRSPFQGEHWIFEERSPRAAELDRPFFIMFDRIGGELRRVGSAYMVRLDRYEQPPSGLGEADAVWHSHSWCYDVPGEGTALAHDSKDCAERGGRPEDEQIGMIHVWTDVPSAYGLFAHDNPMLPYLAVGLAPPSPQELADQVQGPRARTLALALAETYDARMEYARRVERLGSSPQMRQDLEGRRGRLRMIVQQLKRAQEAGDRRLQATLETAALRQWKAIYDLYVEMAPTEELRAQLVRQYDEGIRASHDLGHEHDPVVHPDDASGAHDH